MLPEPEELDEKTFVLLLCRRDCKTKTYSDKKEAKFSVPRDMKFATLKHLETFAKENM